MIPKIKEWSGQPYRYAHCKYDGIALHVRDQGRECLTRRPTNLAAQLAYSDVMRTFSMLPVGFEVIGELYAPGRPASYVKSAIAKQEPLSFVAFASPNFSPLCWLPEVQSVCESFGLTFAEFLTWPNTTTDDPAILFANSQPAPDLEGFVLKIWHMETWFKWKPTRTVDCVVTDIKYGDGKYAGLVGSLEVSLYDGAELRPVAWAGGMTDAVRYAMSDDPSAWLGRVVEVHYQYVGSQGRLRHPRFVRERDDKAPGDCTIAQL